MNKTKKGVGALCYSEWIIPIIDYYISLRKNERFFEVVLPVIISVFCTSVYYSNNKVEIALKGLSDLLPTAISILIGFTIMMITLLLTSDGANVKLLREKKTDRVVHKKEISLYQLLHIQFTHSLSSEIFLLLIILFYLFLHGIMRNVWIEMIFLGVYIYLVLNILFSILRGITNLYFSFYKVE